jgi:hypothetical protein
MKAWWFAAIGLPKFASEQADDSEAPKGAALASRQGFYLFLSKIW